MSILDIRIGPCTLTFDGVDLGTTVGGVSLSLKTKTITYGDDKIYDELKNEGVVITSRELSVVAPLAETNLNRLMTAFPDAVRIGNRVNMGSGTGHSMTSLARPLIITPLFSSPDNIVTIPLAVPIGDVSIKYSCDDLLTYQVTFIGLKVPNTPLISFGQ